MGVGRRGGGRGWVGWCLLSFSLVPYRFVIRRNVFFSAKKGKGEKPRKEEEEEEEVRQITAEELFFCPVLLPTYSRFFLSPVLFILWKSCQPHLISWRKWRKIENVELLGVTCCQKKDKEVTHSSVATTTKTFCYDFEKKNVYTYTFLCGLQNGPYYLVHKSSQGVAVVGPRASFVAIRAPIHKHVSVSLSLSLSLPISPSLLYDLPEGEREDLTRMNVSLHRTQPTHFPW